MFIESRLPQFSKVKPEQVTDDMKEKVKGMGFG